MTEDFTLEFWFKSSSLTQEGKYLVSRSGLDPSRQWAVIYNFTKGAVEFYSSSGYSGTNPRTGSAMPVSDTNWHHIAYRHSGGNWSGYLDGERIFSIASPFQLSTINNNLYIGGTVGGVGPVNLVQGCIDEVRIWKTGLTGETISDWMYREVDYTHPDYADLADYYKLNEGTGTLINDEQGIVNGTFKNGLVSHWK
ncbi:MAG TPA: LamG domain-containing protein, partial [Clostridia bacterium]|nr:LamG domain-containing protein [Clostridia bacterium]